MPSDWTPDVVTFILGAIVSIFLAGLGWLHKSISERVQQAENKAEGEGKRMNEVIRAVEARIIDRMNENSSRIEKEIDVIMSEIKSLKNELTDIDRRSYYIKNLLDKKDDRK